MDKNFNFEYKKKMPTDLELNFCNYLKKWFETEFDGSQVELARLLNVSQQQINNVLAGRRGGSEEWRRMVVKKIGVDYDTAMGIRTGMVFEPKPIYAAEGLLAKFKDKDLARRYILLLAKIEVLEPAAFAGIENYLRGMIDTLTTLKKRKNRISG